MQSRREWPQSGRVGVHSGRWDHGEAGVAGEADGWGQAADGGRQTEIVCAQVCAMGERFRCCEHCDAKLLSKGYYPASFRSVFGDVDVRIRRLRACGCRAGQPEPKSFAAMFAQAVWRQNSPTSGRSSP
jgi:hypothetical protein